MLVLLLAAPRPIALPGGEGGIGFDDLRYDPIAKRVLVPAGRTGNLDLVDPETLAVEAIGGFSKQDSRAGNHGQSVTSADVADGAILAIDRTALEVVTIDPKTKRIATRSKLAAAPDYVRWVAPTREVWVTEPHAEQIEIFSFPELKHVGAIKVPGGPESLVIDVARKRAHTHLWKRSTVVIDLAKRSIVATWPAGCEELRGIALDGEKGWLFVGCEEGKATVLDVGSGKVLSSSETAKGVDIIAYDPKSRRLYAPGEERGDLTILSVSDRGALSLRATVQAAGGAHCVTVDEHSRAFVCDPDHGRILVIDDR